MRLLVTGGAGFIGSNFVYYWLDKHPEDHIVVLDALTYAGNRSNLAEAEKNSQVEFVHGDILDEPLVENVMTKYKIDTIVNFAAESHVDRSIHGPDVFINTNIVGTHTLLKVAKKIWLGDQAVPHRFHHISTDEVYGTLGPEDPPFSEITPYAPNSPYAASKASSDHLVRAYHETYGLKTTISNCSNNYGPFQFPEKLIPLILINILFGKPLPIYGDGRQIRDWLYVDDHNRGVDLILDKGVPGETYNIGGNNEWTNIDIVKLVCNIVKHKFKADPSLSKRFPGYDLSKDDYPHCLVTFVKDRAGHDRRYAINATKITEELGYSPAIDFETGITKTIDWFILHESWWRGLLGESYNSWLKINY